MAKFIISGFSDEIAPTLQEQIKGLHRLNISYAELRNIDGCSVCSFSDAKARELKTTLDQNDIKVSSLGSYIGKQKIQDPFTHDEDFKRALEVASILDTKYIRMFSFFMGDEKPAKYRDEVMTRWFKFLEIAKGYDITLLHENEKGIYGDIPERNIDIIKTLNSNQVKLVFDAANYVQCDVDTKSTWDLIAPYVAYVHVKDALATNHEVVPVGAGDGNCKFIIDYLNKNYCGDMFLSLEPHLSNFKGFAELEDSGITLPEGDNFEKFEIAKKSLDKLLTEI